MTPPEDFLEARDRFSDLPFEAILKADLLRLGISFSPEALKIAAAAKPKSYFIFSFNLAAQKDLSVPEREAAPEEIALTGGPYDLKRTIVSVRLNPASPYCIDVLREKRGPQARHARNLALSLSGNRLADVTLPENPPYYETVLTSGKQVTEIAPTIEWGYLIYLTVFRLCQYWGAEEECLFCDINHNYREQRSAGRPYTAIKRPEEVVEALRIIDASDHDRISRAYTVTGGAITTEVEGINEARFFARYAEAIEREFPGRWIGKTVAQALPPDDLRLLKGAGFRIYHPNFEVWDRRLFAALCPGKERTIGREEWIRRILAATAIFGEANVIPNFVAGVEMARPHGFKTVKEAIASTAEGIEFFMSRGILPRFTVWCLEPGTALGKENREPPPLGYFLELMRIYRDRFRRHRLPLPEGYGEAGVGRAVFSVSPFMDIL